MDVNGEGGLDVEWEGTGEGTMGPEWLSDKEIDVDINHLQDFAKHIRAEVEQNFTPSFEHGIKPMLMVQAPFGSGGLGEAKFFRSRHDESRAAAASMLGEVMKGLTALHLAATSIAADYLTGDALAQASTEDVYKSFQGGDGLKTLDDIAKQTPPDKQVDGAIPDEAKDPSKYFTDKNGDGVADGDKTGGMYDESWVAKNTSGQYYIPADTQHLNDPSLDVPTNVNQ
ncbi:hypothetical protein [Krasilnikovia sp. MM14-A1259]|uniref:hypothetical protein n=1 Tax=Krasilnikovia sp. MM14-A1259 TaxID=3373539 RepID=UPI00381ADC2D